MAREFPVCAGREMVVFEEDYDWSGYSDEMLARIKKRWRIPEMARFGVPGSVEIRYLILPDGHVGCMDFVERSGRVPLDMAAWNAIALASPLKPLPEDRPNSRGEFVSISFYYNMDPPPEGVVKFEGGYVKDVLSGD